MKTDNHTPELDDLLATLEHAGRDARRREELGAMIDRLVAAEAPVRRRSIRFWMPRVAAAACILFFIFAAVRIWVLPTEPQPLVAQADNLPVPAETIPVETELPIVRSLQPSTTHPVETYRAASPTPTTIPIENVTDVLAETQPLPSDTLIPDPVPLPVEDTLLVEAPATNPPDEPQLVQSAPAESPKPRRQSFWKSLFRQFEPDEMNGKTLEIKVI